MDNVEIVRWDDKYHQSFIDLSVEWLEEYVSVEPADLEILKNPHEKVLDNGGEIFFALADGKAVGTVAMINAGGGVFELAKLAVSPEYKGRKIGKLLMQHAISFAEEKNAGRIILYTNHKLVPAIRLYEKMGFVHTELSNNKYIESDMKMQLEL